MELDGLKPLRLPRHRKVSFFIKPSKSSGKTRTTMEFDRAGRACRSITFFVGPESWAMPLKPIPVETPNAPPALWSQRVQKSKVDVP
jgi:hypothetical protein